MRIKQVIRRILGQKSGCHGRWPALPWSVNACQLVTPDRSAKAHQEFLGQSPERVHSRPAVGTARLAEQDSNEHTARAHPPTLAGPRGVSISEIRIMILGKPHLQD